MSAAFGDDDHRNDLVALFSGADEHPGAGEESRLLDALHGDDPGGYGHAAAAWDTDEPSAATLYGDSQTEFTHEPTDLSGLHAPSRSDTGKDNAERNGPQPATVTNPAGTVWVSAGISGNTLRVHLSVTAVAMAEADLAEEICILADLARLKGQAGHHSRLVESGFGAVADMGLPTPERAAATQAEVFAARYADND